MNVPEKQERQFKEEFKRIYGHGIEEGNLQATLKAWNQTGGAA